MIPGSGDIIALVSLTVRVARAIDETSGTSAEVTQLRTYIKTFAITLSTVSNLLNSIEDDPTSQAALDQINQHIKDCNLLLDNFLEMLRPYCVSMTENNKKNKPGHTLRLAFLKVFWAFVKKKDVTALERRLEGHHKQIMLLLQRYGFVLFLSSNLDRLTISWWPWAFASQNSTASWLQFAECCTDSHLHA